MFVRGSQTHIKYWKIQFPNEMYNNIGNKNIESNVYKQKGYNVYGTIYFVYSYNMSGSSEEL